MNRRAKSRRRLLILLTIFVVVGSGLGGLYLARKSRFKAENMALRKEGMRLFEQGHYFQALHKLGTYINRLGQQDAQAIDHYAQAREKVPEDKGKHLAEAIGMYRRYLGLRPDDDQARRHLLDLYTQVGSFNTESLGLAEKLLQQSPDDADALRGKAYAEGRLGRYAAAITDARHSLQVDPSQDDVYFLIIEMMNGRGDAPRQWLAQAEQWLDQHPDDPRFEVVMAYAFSLARQSQQAIDTCVAAASAKTLSRSMRQRLCQLMQVLQRQEAGRLLATPQTKTTTTHLAALIDQTTDLLEQLAENSDDLEIKREWAKRLWELGRVAELADYTFAKPPVTIRAYDDLLALRALARLQLKRRTEAQAALDELAGSDKPVAHAWSILLRYRLSPATHPNESVALLEEAANADPSNAYIKLELAQAYAVINEIDRAIKINAQAFILAPAWPIALVQQARLLEMAGHPREATRLAMATMQCIPKRFHHLPGMFYAARECATAWAGLVPADQSTVPPDLMNLLEEIHRAHPFEPQTFGLYIRLLSQSGHRQQAQTLIDQFLAQKDPSPSLLVSLLNVNRSQHLERQSALRRRLDEHPVTTADLALRQSVQLYDGKTKQPALQAFQSMRNQAADPHSRQWQMAWAQLLERIGDERAAAEWTRLADAPENQDYLPVQLLVLQSRTAWSDRDVIDRAIQRLRRLSGDANINWRVFRAKWWMLSADSDSRALGRAVTLLQPVLTEAPANAQALGLYARCLVLQHKFEQAIEPLGKLLKLNPKSIVVALELASCHVAAGHDDQAGKLLQAIIEQPDAQVDQMTRAAGLLNQIGQTASACRALEKLDERGQADEQSQVLLASLYQRSGHPERAEAIYRRLLASKSVGLISIEYAANFYAAQGRMDQANQVLDRLAEIGAEPVDQHLVRANFLFNRGQVDQADKQFRQATTLAPTQGRVWLQYLRFLHRTGQWSRVMDTVEKAAPLCPREADLKDLATAVKLVRQSVRPDAQAEQALRQLDRLVAGRPTFYLLQILAIHHDLGIGRYDHAAELATGVMRQFPKVEEPAEMAVRAMVGAGQWSGVLSACRQWRQRSADPFRADLMTAEACIQTSQFAKAQEVLKDYLPKASPKASPYAAAIVVTARAMVLAGQVDQAAGLMAAHLEESVKWRSAWATLALQIKDHRRAAQWLEQLTKHLPQDQPTEWVALAQIWWRLAGQAKQAAYSERAYRILNDLTGRYPPAHYHLAVLYEKDGRVDQARSQYQNAIAGNADARMVALARNNLAMLILNTRGDAKQAVNLARQAVQQQPTNPVFLDTLAQAQARAGDYAGSDATWDKAMKADAANPLWPIQLLDAQVTAGRLEQARQTLQAINERFAMPRAIDGQLRTRLEKLKQALATTDQITQNDRS